MRPAISFAPGKTISYQELDTLSDQASHYLSKKGVNKGDRVALILEKCASFYILVLACLKIGAVYVALDPRNPSERARAILDQCRPKLVFSHTDCPEGASLPEWLKGQPEFVLPSAEPCGGKDPAYIMFTSGSTGLPKGAMMSHDNLEHFIAWLRTEYEFTPDDIHTHLNPVFFDNTVFDLYSALFTGGQLVPFTQTDLMQPGVLVKRLRDMRCTVWFSVPSLLMYLQVMKVVVPEYFVSLRQIIFGGEVFPKARLKEMMETLGERIRYINVSGPTECTCICSSYRVTERDFDDMEGAPALGSLTGPFKGFILDGDTEVQDGEVGELCLSGPCVGLGYFEQPELTRKVFVTNPVDPTMGTLYRTGDLVKRDPRDRKLYFAGRKDLQIKHMGYRIELEEIQHALSACPGVDENAVLYNKKEDDAGEIVAVVASRKVLQTDTLRSELERRLPRYMMPARYYFVHHLPKNANGKTDRQALIHQLGG